MATTTEDGFHEIQLNGKQLVFLFMALVVMSVVIFLLGVFVGRGVRGERRTVEALSSPAATEPLAGVVPPAPGAPPSESPRTANENLTYPQRLAGSRPPTEKLTAAPPAAVPADAKPTLSAPPAPAKPAQPKATVASPAAEPTGSGYAIQVAALRQRAEAESVVRSLTAKGYPAYVLNPEGGAPSVFRVRVGKYKDRHEAESVAARLEKEEQFKPWIVR